MRIYGLSQNPYGYYQHPQITFGTMKKRDFEGVDFAVVEKFKAPIQKFKTNDDLQKWADAKIRNEYLNTNFGGRTHETRRLRKSIFNNWLDFLSGNDDYKNTTKLLILNAITKDLKDTTNTLPPELDIQVLNTTVNNLENILKNEPKMLFDFKKIYNANLLEKCLNDSDKCYTGWVKIPSRLHDEKNFDKNVDKLKLMSYHTWCTKNMTAREYLAAGDFHIYNENGAPKIGIRLKNDEIREIQGELNNSMFAARYLAIVNNYIKDQNLILGNYAQKEINQVSEQEKNIDKIRKDLQQAIQNNAADEIFKYFNIKYSKDKDGLYIIDKFEQPDEYYTFSDLGIDENKLIQNVKEITHNAEFADSKITELTNLRVIRGNADFSESIVENLNELEQIGGDAIFTNSKITSLNKLKSIGKTADFSKSNVKDLGELTTIGEHAIFSYSHINDLGKLEYIGWSPKFQKSNITSLKHLREIGGNARFEESLISDLGDLQSIGKNAYFQNSLITDLKNLETIGGDAVFSLSNVQNLGKLCYIGNCAFIQKSNFTMEDFDDIGVEDKVYP